MNLSVLIPLLAAIAYAVLLIIVVRQRLRSSTDWAFAIYLFGMTFWSSGSFMLHANFPNHSPHFWSRFTTIFGISTPVIFFYFTQEFLGIRNQRKWLYLGVGLYFAFVIVTMLGYTIVDASVTENGIVYFDFGPGLILLVLISYFFIGFSIYNLYIEHRQAKDERYRNRIKYPLIGVSMVMLGASTNFTPLGRYPIDITVNLINALLITYAMVRHELLDVSLVVRKGVAYTTLSAVVAATYLVPIIIFELLLQRVNPGPFFPLLFFSVIIAVAMAVTIQPLHAAIKSRVDRFFFREQYDAYWTVQELGHQIAATLDLDNLTSMLLDQVAETLHVTTVGLLLKETDSDEYYLVDSLGVTQNLTHLKWREGHPVSRWLAHEGKILTKRQLDIVPQLRGLWGQDRAMLTQLSSELFVPLRAKDNLVGILVVGPKQSEETFTDDDKRLLSTLASQIAVAVENARLYDQAQQEIVERIRAEERIKTSLQEKEILLKEIHHRVKNNLQVISSLFGLQSDYTRDRQIHTILRESQHRIHSMALIHEHLYQSKDLSRVDFSEYIHNLVTSLFHSYELNSSTKTIVTNVDDVYLDIDMAIPCGLIISELVSNSLKHAFPAGQAGEISIELHLESDNQMRLLIRDNGVGLPKDLDFRKAETLGLELVNMLTYQLKGSIKLDRNGGTAYTITFALRPGEVRI